MAVKIILELWLATLYFGIYLFLLVHYQLVATSGTLSGDLKEMFWEERKAGRPGIRPQIILSALLLWVTMGRGGDDIREIWGPDPKALT